MMNCNTLHKKIIFFIEGELPGWEMEEVKIHLERCTECAAFAEEMKKTLVVFETDKHPQINPFFYTRVKAQLENRSEEAFIRRHSGWVSILQPAFFTVLLLAGIYAGFKIGTPAKINNESTVYVKNEMIPYLNEMETEAIENFLME